MKETTLMNQVSSERIECRREDRREDQRKDHVNFPLVFLILMDVHAFLQISCCFLLADSFQNHHFILLTTVKAAQSVQSHSLSDERLVNIFLS